MDRFSGGFDNQSSPEKKRISKFDSPASSFGQAFASLFGTASGGVGGGFKSLSDSAVGSAWTSMSRPSGISGTFGSSSPFQADGSAANMGFWRQSGVQMPGMDGSASDLGAGVAGLAGNLLGGGGGDVSQNPGFAGGNFNKDPKVFNEIGAAAAKHGVPANLLKSMIARESTGDWERDGNRTPMVRPGDRILPYVGIFESTARSWGYDFNQMVGNRALQIDAMAKGLSILYQNVGDQYGWDGVISTYYSGKPDQSYTPPDSYQHGTTAQYVASIKDWWAQEDAWTKANGGSVGTGGGLSGGAGGGAISTIWGGNGERDLSYGFGAPNDLGYYAYGASYGMDGRAHTGVDIPMNIGEAVVSPVSGTVVCGGTGVGSGADGGGCSAFADVMGRGAGRVEVQLDNGETVIFGHMSTSNFRPGQRVNAGDVIGEAGGMNGGHVHLEWRVRDGSTSSGWRIVDPMGKLGQGGAVISSQQGSPNNSAGYTPTNLIGNTWQRQQRTVGGYRF